MRHRIRITRAALIFTMIAVAFTAANTGCQSLRTVAQNAFRDERSALKVATELYTVTVNRLADLREQGRISDEEYRRIEHYRKAARKALDGWRLALQESGSPEQSIGRFYEALTELTEAVEDRNSSSNAEEAQP